MNQTPTPHWIGRRRPAHLLALTLAGIAFCAAGARAAEWPQWRGPHFNGATEESNLPTQWSEAENVRWKTELPGPSGSTPVVWGDRVFLNTPDKEKNLRLLCLSRIDGKILWDQVVAVGDRSSGRNNMASPSPVTDGKRVITLFGTGDMAAYDMDGKEIWSRNLGKDYGRFALMWLYGSSPLLFNGKLYVQVLQRNTPGDYPHAIDGNPTRDSYLLCLDPETGKDLWREIRPTDASKESHESYATPIPFQGPKGTEIIVLGGDYTTGHDAETGKELWRAGGLNPRKDDWWRIVPSPVAGKDLVYSSAPKRDPVFAIQPGGKGDVTSTHIKWQFNEFPTDWSTPLYYKESLFVLDGDRKVLTKLNPATGEKIWQGELPTREVIWSSPLGADGKIYCVTERGTVLIMGAGDKFEVLNTIKMGGEPVRSSVIAAHGSLFIRTGHHLYCVGK